MNKKTLFIIIIILVAFTFAEVVTAQQPGALSLQVTPGLALPIGDSSDTYVIGGGAELSADYSLPFASWLKARGALDFTMAPTEAADSLSLLTFSAGVGFNVNLGSKFYIHGAGMGGYGLGIYGGATGGSAYAGASGGIGFNISPSFALGVGGAYNHYFSDPTPLFQGVKISIGTKFRFGVGEREPQIQVDGIRFDPVFPVFYKHYDDHPLGSVIIRNTEKGTITNIKVSFLAPQYMDKPKLCFQADELQRDSELEVPLYALFTDNVLSITEGTKISAQIITEYSFADSVMVMEVSETLRLYDRNAMTWDDDRKAAAFITAKDPEILRFSKNIAGLVRENNTRAVNLNFRIAMGLFEGLGVYGVNYVIDPQTPYADFSSDSAAIDYLQFPVQTMDYRAGDCDDLSILYCTLLESTGIETAFITVPGHIFTAFNIGMPPDEAKRMFRNPGDLIYIDNSTWLPVEITLIQDGFLMAWERGAKQWREHDLEGNSRLFPIHEAWSEFEPVGLTGAASGLQFPDQDEIMETFDRVIVRFVEKEIADKVETYERRISESNNNPRLVNKLGVLYAQYGMTDKASGYFEQAAGSRYAPAMINLGNIRFLENEYEEALESYEQAEELESGSLLALLGIAKVNYELENYGTVNRTFEEIQRKDPDLASRFSYLVSESTEAGRASSALIRDIVVWGEED